ncbi:FAD-dependent oxidoreductase [Microbacterium sp. KSW2-29]|uniref:FAD-dependent oxidoreductase n=1 Tax=Microbacterium phycohabitans TaxID=3075993 RepID=A0ABU3SLM8_9MICO|nr:FAD-dependent oxidoreductase [Microbacterium sp. KSW2-29]MDU0345703.1 FAD-dependent oxidoreductase [Microbacterium sp. KSW2-29]
MDVAVIGAGAMGAATAWQLARRGVSVEVFEQFEPGHVRGASHGASRNFNVAYDEPGYLSWLREARALWRELERESATALLQVTGIVNHGGGRDLVRAALAIRAGGFGADLLDAREAGRRWPGIRFDGPVLHTPDAGRLDADAAVAALLSGAVAAGGHVHWRTRVDDLAVRDDDGVEFRAIGDAGERVVRARRVVVTAGAWTTRVLKSTDAAGVLPRLRVTQEQPAHFAPHDASTPWPGFNHLPAPDAAETMWFPAGIYGMLTPGEGVKAGWHAAGPEIDPDRRSFTPDPALTAALVRYAREWLPGVDPGAFTEVTCTYTSTPDARFVLERVGPVVIGAGFSGHGFKFTPVIGRILADAVGRD